MGGPLTGVHVVELTGMGPGPFAAMVLADMGADVVRVDRPGSRQIEGPGALLGRSRRSIAVDLKRPEGIEILLDLVFQSDVLIEGYRPGVTERLGIGPDECLGRNPRLIYGRMTGWGQDGPYAQMAGHDINYIAVAGALHAIGRVGQPPTPPLNLVGDFGGGGMLLAFGIAAALVERSSSGKGQVIDAAMVDGVALLMTFFCGYAMSERGSNGLDGGSPFYDAYECADGEYLSVGALEPGFYEELRSRLGLTDPNWDRTGGPTTWPSQKHALADLFRTRTRDEWWSLVDGSDACVAPVLNLSEAAADPHLVARQTYINMDGMQQPAPAPRFSRSVPESPNPPARPGQHSDQILAQLGLDERRIKQLRQEEVVS